MLDLVFVGATVVGFALLAGLVHLLKERVS